MQRLFFLAALFGIGLGAVPAAAGERPLDVAIVTTLGTIVVRLEPRRAPGTVANFMRYVDAHRYDGTTFYRTVDRRREPGSQIDVIQGGLQDRAAQNTPIALEPPARTGLHNDDGTIAMARTSAPDSASSEFFINLASDRFLDALGGGYAVFGRIIRGREVALTINTAPARGQSLDPPIVILRVSRVR